MKQHSVPENIMDVEFKLFGSLSAKQFGYIIAGGCIAIFFYYLFKSLESPLLGWIFAAISVILGLSLALVRINEQPFEVWLVNFLGAMFSSQKRVWRKKKKVPQALSDRNPTSVVKTKRVVKPDIRSEPSAKTQDTPVSEESFTEKQTSVPKHPFKDLTSQKQDSQVSENLQSNVVKAQQLNNQIAGQGVQGDTYYIPGSAQKFGKITSNQEPNRPINYLNKQNMDQNTNSVKTDKPIVDMQSKQGNVNTSGLVGSVSQNPKQSEPQVDDNKGEFNTQSQTVNRNQDQANQGSQSNTSQQAQHMNKAVQYNDVVPNKNQTFQQVEREVQNSPSLPTRDNNSPHVLKEENEKLRQKVVEFSEDKRNLEGELKKTKGMYEDIQKQNEQIVGQLKELQLEMESLKEGKGKETIDEGDRLKVQELVQDGGGVLTPKIYNGPSLSKKPNVISGIVRTKDGKLLPGVVVIVKNEKARPVRAIKTNSLGQFITTTALENGIYTIELSRNNYSFGRYEVNLTGDVLPTYEFIAG